MGLSIAVTVFDGVRIGLWAAWFAVAVFVMARTGWWRPRPDAVLLPDDAVGTGASARPAVAQRVPLLAVAGLLSFVAWVATQLIYLSVRHPNVPTADGRLSWSAVDLARLSLLSAVAGWAVGFGLVVAGRGMRVVGYSARRFPGGMLLGVIGLLLALPLVFAALQATLAVLALLGNADPPKHELLQVLDNQPGRLVRVMAVAAAVVAAPLFEELLFRGCVQNGLRRATRSPWIGILVASGLFASIHPPWTIPPIFVFSVLLGIVYERSRNLWATTCMHALFNAIAIVTSGSS